MPICRVGLANPNSRMAIAMENRGLPVLVSANSLFNHKTKQFREVPPQLMDLDVSLDSAGFVAMAKYGRFPWSIRQYVNLAILGGFTWWSSMDCCCEPEIAENSITVNRRVHATAQLLRMCRNQYFDELEQCPEIAMFTQPPMPILQGWTPDDYRLSIDLTNVVLNGNWPSLIGIGSVCRRQLSGPDGLWRILHSIDSCLTPHVGLHLFGVKGSTMRGLQEHPRVVSVDSMAFEFRARVLARTSRVSKSTDFRLAVMDQWLARQDALSTVSTDQFDLNI